MRRFVIVLLIAVAVAMPVSAGPLVGSIQVRPSTIRMWSEIQVVQTANHAEALILKRSDHLLWKGQLKVTWADARSCPAISTELAKLPAAIEANSHPYPRQTYTLDGSDYTIRVRRDARDGAQWLAAVGDDDTPVGNWAGHALAAWGDCWSPRRPR
jgi:hypothetical protein